jgi:hypothetical protein
MNKLLKSLLFLSIFSSTFANAATLNKIEVFPPFVATGCSNLETDSAGKVALGLNKLTATESSSKITFSLNEQLKVCNVSIVNNQKTLSFQDVNPFKGYEVQYYDFKTNSIATRTEVIDSESKNNRFETGIFIADKSIALKSNLQISGSNALIGVIELSKSDLLDQNDYDLLNDGAEIVKSVILFHTLNVTTIIDGQKIEIGDQNFSGRNIRLTFAKVNKQIKVKSISL